MPGWNWISYPNAVAMTIDDALGGFTPTQGDVIKSQFASCRYVNGHWLGQLTQFLPGKGYMYYSMRGEETSFVFASSSASSVAVTTMVPTPLSAVSASGGGEVVSDDGTYIIVKGICWATHATPTSNDNYLEFGSGEGSFTTTWTDLEIYTTYYVRAYAVTPSGTVYGEQQVFTTKDGIPEVTTVSVNYIRATAAFCYGNVTDDCGLDVSRGVCWSTGPNPSIRDDHSNNGSGIGSFSSYITGLTPGTTYYVRAYATTSQGTAYGEELSFTTQDGVPTVSTVLVTNIASNMAMSGGIVTADGGSSVIARGVCWSTSPNPSIHDNHSNNGSGIGSFTSSITGLETNTTYYVRAYASTSFGTGYGDEVSFSTNDDLHDYVDLGLPSGTLWAVCNVGADFPEDYGDYFAWAETQTKSDYSWSNYMYCNGSSSTLTKYCYNSSYGNNGFADYLSILLPEDDAATACWGEEWRLPTKAEWRELYQSTTVSWITLNGVSGRLFTASNGNSLFLPAAGYRNNDNLSENGVAGDYLSSSLYTSVPSRAWEFTFDANTYSVGSYGHRKLGLSVRAVRSYKPTQDYVDLGLPSGLLWATCNVGACSPGKSGDFFAWGETQPKDYASYDWEHYQFSNGGDHALTKYCNNPDWGYNGFTDDLTTLLPEDDAAKANLGGDWRMPTKAEWQELCQYTTVSASMEYGVYGMSFVGSNGNRLFLPAANCIPWEGMSDTGEFGYYWSSSLVTNGPSSAWNFRFYSGDYHDDYSIDSRFRTSGRPVRAVRSARKN